MRHPLEFIPLHLRKPFFFTFLILTSILIAVFQILDQPLRTAAAPDGIVSFELAGTSTKARQILASWMPAKGSVPEISRTTLAYAAFGLGLDYLFMPAYALTLAFAALLASQNHRGWIKSSLAVAAYGAYAAALFDAVENYALFQVLLGNFDTGYPEVAAYCATIKFGLLVFGILVTLAAWLFPKKGDRLSALGLDL